MNIYDVLLGDPLEQDKMREVARQLRRQEAYGTLGALTGDPVLAPFGQNMMRRAGVQAEGLRKAKEAALANRRAEAMARPLGEGFYQQGTGPVTRFPGWAEAQERKRQHALEKVREAARVREEASARAFQNQEAYRRSFIPEATWRGPKGVAQGLSQIEALGALVDPMKQASDISSPALDVMADFAGDIGLGGVARMTEPLYRSLDSRQLRSSLENLLAKIRNSMFGAALTRYEGTNYEKVSPLAPGLKKDAMVQRTQKLVDFLTKEANTLVSGRKSPSGAPLPSFLEGWEWQDSSGDREASALQGVDTGTRAKIIPREGWVIEEVK